MKTRFGKIQKFFLLTIFILTAAFVVTPLASASAQMMQKKPMMVNPCNKKPKMMHKVMMHKMSLKQAKLIARGKKLFYSKSIGTNGFSCATCHVYSAGTYIKMHGMGMVIRSVKNAAEKIMAFNKMHHTHLTLEKKIALCDKMVLKGHISKGELEALTAYVNSVK